jgi:DNA-binding protein HU-beta
MGDTSLSAGPNPPHDTTFSAPREGNFQIAANLQVSHSPRRSLVNKNDLVAKVADKSGLSKKDSEKALNAFIEAVADGLKEGDKVSVVGFGTFEVRERAARKGRNPQTGKEINIPASKTPAFKAGKSLKDLVG